MRPSWSGTSCRTIRDNRRLATRLLESLSVAEPGFVPLVSVVEISSVLQSAYGLDRRQWIEAFAGLPRTRELVVACAEIVWRALRLLQGTNADFADCLIACAATSAGCAHTMTLDRGAARFAGMTLIG